MGRRMFSSFARALLIGSIYFFNAGVCPAQSQPEAPARDIEAARARIERRVTDQERKAVAERRAAVHPDLAARIAKTRAALTNARDARIEELKSLNKTTQGNMNAQGGANE